MSQNIWRLLKSDYLILVPILALAFFMAFIPHMEYPYALHVDEWVHISYIESILQKGNLSFTNPFHGQDTVTAIDTMEFGFQIFWGSFQRLSGLSWMFIFRYFPSVIFMIAVLSVYALGRRQGFGWESAFFACLITTGVGVLGPALLVPVAMAIIFIALIVFLALNFRSFWSYLTIFVFICSLLVIHAPNAIFAILILVPHILLNLKSNFRHSLYLSIAMALPFIASIPLAPEIWVTTLSELSALQTLPTHVDFPNIIYSFGLLPIILCILGTFMLTLKRHKGNLDLVLGLLMMLLMLVAFYTFHYGVVILYERGFTVTMMMLSIPAGAMLMWIKKIQLPEALMLRINLPLALRRVGIFLCLLIIGATLYIAIPDRQQAPFYHMIDHNDYDAFVWIKDNVSNDYEKAILDPWKATAFTAITGKKTYARLHSWKTEETQEAAKFILTGCTNTEFLRENGISIIYAPSGCSNIDLEEIIESVYLLK